MATAVLLAAGCATSIAGQATIGSAGGTTIPTVVSQDSGGLATRLPSDSDGPQTDTAGLETAATGTDTDTDTEAPDTAGLDTGAPDTAATDTGAPASTEAPDTHVSSPPPSTPQTQPAPSAPATSSTAKSTGPSTTAGTAKPSGGTKGVPPIASGNLRKKVGQSAGISDADNTRTFNFTVTAIDPDYRSHCTDPAAKQAKGGTLIAVKISYDVLSTYKTASGAISLTPDLWSVRTADGTVDKSLSTAAAKACLKAGLGPNRPLKVGDKGSGWVVLESTARYGVLQLTEPNVRGAWEWVIPGS
ncbi:MAG: hypothetical protein ACR2P2_21930 [Nakamurella sp.]